MKEITLKIPDKKFRFFMELIESLGFVTVKEPGYAEASPYNPEFVEKIKQGEKDIAEGKGIKMSVKEFDKLVNLEGLEQGFREVKLMEEGKLKGTRIDTFLDEL